MFLDYPSNHIMKNVFNKKREVLFYTEIATKKISTTTILIVAFWNSLS